MATTELQAPEETGKKTYPVLKMPDPSFNIKMLGDDKVTGLFSKVEREERIGDDQVLVNELSKEGDKPFAFGVVKIGEGKKFKSIAAVPKELADSVDEFTMREFQAVKGFWFHPFTLVKAFNPAVELKTPVPGHRVASEVDLDTDTKKEDKTDKRDVPEELLLFAVSDSTVIPIDKDAEIKEPSSGPDFVLAVPGKVKPWLIFPLDHANDIQAEQQASEIVAARKSEIGVVAARIGDLAVGIPAFSAKTLLRAVPMRKASSVDEILLVSPDELKEVSDKILDDFYLQLHVFFENHFTGNTEETTDGVSREDVVNAYFFVAMEMKTRGRLPEAKDELDSELKDLAPAVFKKEAGRYKTSEEHGHSHISRVDAAGNGKTVSGSDHVHEIKEWGVMEAGTDGGHIHDLGEMVEDKGEEEISFGPEELAETEPSGEKVGREITLKEVLQKVRSFRFRKDAISIVGGLANKGCTENDIDILIKGPIDPDTLHVLRFRLGRMLGPELSKRVQFLDDDLGGPFTNHVPLGNLAFECDGEFTLKQMRDLYKQDDPHQDLPKETGKKSAVFQLHFRGKSVHGDFRADIGDYLVGWTLDLQKSGEIKEPVTTLSDAKIVGSGYEPSDGNRFLKPFLAPAGVESQPKLRQPQEWLNVAGDVYEPGKPGSTKKFPAVFIAVDKPQVEFGRQSADFHEYFLTDGKVLKGILMFRRLSRGGDGKTFWRGFLSEDLVPTILETRTVRKGVMPPDGYSWIPKSLEQDVPEEFRYWEKKGAEAKKMRDTLVKSGLFRKDSIRIVDNDFRLVKQKVFVDKGEGFEEVLSLSDQIDLTIFDEDKKKIVDKFLKKRLSIIKGEEGDGDGDEEKDERIVYGIVLEPEEVDSQDDVYSEEEIRDAAHLFMEEFRHLGLQHKVRLDGRLKILETYIAPQDLTINGQEVKKGTWLMVIRVLDDELWNAVKNRELTGLSIGGSARKKPETVAV